MSRQTWIAVMLLAVGALVVAVAVTMMIQPAAAQGREAQGPYQVVAADNAFVLFDAGTSKSWVLIPEPGDHKPGWIPIERLDNDSQVRNWHARKQAGK